MHQAPSLSFREKMILHFSRSKFFKLLRVGALLALASGCCATLKNEIQQPSEALLPVRYAYPKFQDDMDFDSLLGAIEKNAEYLNRLNPETLFTYGPHQYTCRQVLESQKFFGELIRQYRDQADELNRQIRKHFLVYGASGYQGDRKVLFTGYFEPVYEGNLTADDAFRYPLYGQPDDLIKIDLSLFREEFKGKNIVARIEGKEVLPYYARKEIETDRALDGRGLELVWLKDPVDCSYLQIQGSGRIKLPDGSTMAVGYEAANGRPFKSIARYLMDRGFLKKEELSMQSIRRFLAEHPEQVREILNSDPSYVFFRQRVDGPYGNINVLLTAGRSIALDSYLFPKGALGFILCQKPVINEKEEVSQWVDFSRFIVNQDTGGAIRGAHRADIFWGTGYQAGLEAGQMKNEGKLYILIKKP
ncbi:MAG: transglycosylase [Desulfobacteraceae bacterium]|nr:MAG: transglycosylase [Desulfobacteraceae bacterium]